MTAIESARKDMRVFAVVSGLLAIFGAIHVAGNTLWLNTPSYLIDFWFDGDVAWRAWLGQVPHVDFETPVGQAYFWVHAVTASVTGPTTSSMLAASALVGVLAGLLGCELLRRDAPAWIVVLVALYAFGCAVTPRWMGLYRFWPDEFSHLAPYNRWGWGLLIPIALFPLLPGRSRRIDALPAILAGVATAFLILMKVTYGLAAAGLLGLALVTGGVRLATAGIVFASVCAALLLTHLVEGNLLAYVSDIRAALEAASESFIRRAYARRMIAENGVLYGLAVAVILLIGVRRDLASRRLGEAFWKLWRPAIFCGAILCVGFGLSLQNHPKTEAPFFATSVILAYLWARPGLQGTLWWRDRVPQAISVALVLLAFGYTSGRDLLSIVLHRVGAFSDIATAVPELEDTVYEGLRLPASVLERAREPVPADPEECLQSFVSPGGQLRVALDGLAAIDQVARPSDVIFDLHTFNPYPAIRRAPSPPGLLWFDFGRTFSLEVHPEPEFLRSVDVIVRETGCPTNASIRLWEVYGDAIEAAFVPAVETKTKRVYVRRAR